MFLVQSIEIQKRVGSFSTALDTINKCLSEAICALFRGRLDGESRTAGLIHSGNEILETYTYYPDARSYWSSCLISWFHTWLYLDLWYWYSPISAYSLRYMNPRGTFRIYSVMISPPDMFWSLHSPFIMEWSSSSNVCFCISGKSRCCRGMGIYNWDVLL